MKIKVTSEGKKIIALSIPTALGINYLSATFAPFFINRKVKNGKKIKVRSCWKFVRAFNKVKKNFSDFDLVEVETSDGTYVKITI